MDFQKTLQGSNATKQTHENEQKIIPQRLTTNSILQGSRVNQNQVPSNNNNNNQLSAQNMGGTDVQIRYSETIQFFLNYNNDLGKTFNYLNLQEQHEYIHVVFRISEIYKADIPVKYVDEFVILTDSVSPFVKRCAELDAQSAPRESGSGLGYGRCTKESSGSVPENNNRNRNDITITRDERNEWFEHIEKYHDLIIAYTNILTLDERDRINEINDVATNALHNAKKYRPTKRHNL